MGGRVGWAIAAAILAFVTSACGSILAVDPPAPESTAHREFAQSLCSASSRCCGERGFPSDGATCRLFVDRIPQPDSNRIRACAYLPAVLTCAWGYPYQVSHRYPQKYPD